MTDAPPPLSVSIDRISVSGVEAATARHLGFAVESALAAAAGQGGLSPGHRQSLRIELPHGTSAAKIAKALTAALARG